MAQGILTDQWRSRGLETWRSALALEGVGRTLAFRRPVFCAEPSFRCDRRVGALWRRVKKKGVPVGLVRGSVCCCSSLSPPLLSRYPGDTSIAPPHGNQKGLHTLPQFPSYGRVAPSSEAILYKDLSFFLASVSHTS